MARLVKLAGGDAEASHEEQDDTEDGKDAGGSYGAWMVTRGGWEEGEGETKRKSQFRHPVRPVKRNIDTLHRLVTSSPQHLYVARPLLQEYTGPAHKNIQAPPTNLLYSD